MIVMQPRSTVQPSTSAIEHFKLFPLALDLLQSGSLNPTSDLGCQDLDVQVCLDFVYPKLGRSVVVSLRQL